MTPGTYYIDGHKVIVRRFGTTFERNKIGVHVFGFNPALLFEIPIDTPQLQLAPLVLIAIAACDAVIAAQNQFTQYVQLN